jgi:hypothetical protein
VQVTNVADTSGKILESASDKFYIWTARDPIKTGSFGFGMTAGVAPSDPARLKELLRESRPTVALIDKAVETISNAADSPRSRNLVGKQCMSIVIPLEPQSGVIANYHSAVVKNTIYLPSFAVSTPNASITAQGGFIEQSNVTGAPNALVVPKVGRNQPCPSGSGTKYKRCHGRIPIVPQMKSRGA